MAPNFDPNKGSLFHAGSQPVIPMRKSRKRRVGVDRSLYRLHNLVERCVNKPKNARRVATR